MATTEEIIVDQHAFNRRNMAIRLADVLESVGATHIGTKLLPRCGWALVLELARLQAEETIELDADGTPTRPNPIDPKYYPAPGTRAMVARILLNRTHNTDPFEGLPQ